MNSFNVHTEFSLQLNTLQTAKPHQLSPATRYYICKLLSEVPNYASADLLAFKARLTEDNCSLLNEALDQMYSDEVELTAVKLQLTKLVYLYATLYTQIALYPDYIKQLSHIKQQIFQLLGFREDRYLQV